MNFLSTRFKFLIVLGAFLIALAPSFSFVSLAADPCAKSTFNYSACQKKKDELAKEAQRNKELAEQKKKEAEELQKIVSQIDSDINATQTKINNTQNQINKTQKEIDETLAQIDQKEKELKVEQDNQDESIKVIYETVNKSTLEIIAGSENISEVVTFGDYLDVLESKIEYTMAEIARLKQELEKKKADLEKKKSDLEGLKSEFQQQSRALQSQKQTKDSMLVQTNQEKKQFQQAAYNASSEMGDIDYQIKQYLASQAAKGGAAIPMGYLFGRNVGAGDIIGYEGSTGNSTGPHVHLEVRQHSGYGGDGNINDFLNVGYANASNPASSCQAGTGIDALILNFGLTKPLSSNARVTACFGLGGYGSGSWSNKFHGGVDTASYYGAPVYASASGRVVFHGDLGAWGNAVVIYSGNGFWTLYGHMI